MSFFSTPSESKAQVTSGQALRHLLVFQLKLLADAGRDLLLSPISVSGACSFLSLAQFFFAESFRMR